MKKFYLFIVTMVFSSAVFAQEDTSKINRDTVDANYKVPVFSITASDVDNDLESQDVSSLLQSSRDVFTSMAGFNLSAGRFRIRGLGGENQLVMINGIPVNNLETGYAAWSNWGGLNDVTRFMEVRIGINACRYNFGGIGGYTNIDSKASSFKKGMKFSYAASNRNYHHRFMMSQSTGLTKKGWAFTYALSGRYAKEGYYEGTFFNAASYYLTVDKKLDEKHTLSFVGFGAPITQGRAGFAVAEVHQLTGNNFYNPNWGYQSTADGSTQIKRNARVSNQHKPTAMFTHYFALDENTKLTSTLYYSYGRNGLTSLNWYDTKDPRPDYYRYLPSYYAFENTAYGDDLTLLWQSSDPTTTQINWDGLYNANYNNLYSQENANGTTETVTGKRSKYIVEEARMDSRDIGFNTVYNTRIKRVFISAGLHGMLHKGFYFKTMNDLLGGDFWVDVDQFAEQSFSDATYYQNDLNTTNKIIKEGDRFGYDYIINVNKFEAFGQAEYAVSKFDFYAGFNVGHSSFWRTGNFKNGRFADNSLGDSETANFFTYGTKFGVAYKISGRHAITLNGAYIVRPPDSRSIFISPRTNNNMVNNLTNESVTGGDVNYIVSYPRLKIRATGFYTAINNQVWARSYYHDEYRNLVNYVLTGVNHLMTGGELGMQVNIIPSLIFQGAFSHGQYIWSSRPTATITRDNSAEVLAEGRTVYMQNYKIGNMPETGGSAGLKYSGKKYWFIGFNFNYFANFYAEPNPDRRTAEALSKYVTDDPQWEQLLTQEKLPNNYTLDAYAGKSWRLKHKYYLNVNVNVNNILNNTNLINFAVEQLRYDNNDPLKFPNKYSYSMGINYFLLISFRF
ncbi:MAG TPA: TonB-dependent receptor plug domain-containing protein [Flavobacteriales bacterium]|nr:TonB-dependent receptor plug domain-containing protein [Flavobacteriales bacterium]